MDRHLKTLDAGKSSEITVCGRHRIEDRTDRAFSPPSCYHPSVRTTATPLPPPRIILLIFAGVACLQIPADLVVGSLSPAWGLFLNETLVILAAPLLILKLSGYRPLTMLHLERAGKRRALVAACGTCGCAVLLSYLQTATGKLVPVPAWLIERQAHPMLATSWQDLYGKLLLLCVVAPVCEEVLFRGIIQRSLARRWGTASAVVASAVFFALVHSASFEPHLYLALGFVFAGIFALTGSLRTVILCHALNNAWALVNRMQGMRFPMEQPMGASDALLLASSAIIVLASATWLLRRRRAHSAR